jgi:tetratricopeptide (TPR) repeat protein
LAPSGESHAAAFPADEGASPLTALLDAFDAILTPLVEQGVGGFESGREELLGRIAEYFLRLSQDRPLLIAIDDLHFADDSSLEVLLRLGLDIRRIRAVVIATAGVEDTVPARARAGLENLSRSPAFRTMPLRPFTLAEVTEFIRWIFGGANPDPGDVLRWYTETEGNPSFIEHLVRSATGYRFSERDIAVLDGHALPDAVFARIRSLGRDERRILSHAAVLGQEFAFTDLHRVTELGEERISECVDRLVQEGLLREKGHESYGFVSEAIRVRIYSDLTETHRRILHRKTGDVLEAKGGTPDSELARHFYLGHDHERAVKYNITAAQSATRDFAFETAATLLVRALESERRRPSPDPITEIRLLTEAGRLLTEAGSPHRSEELLSQAVALARSHPSHDIELGHALLSLAWARYELGEYPSAEGLASEAQGYLPKAGTPRDLMAFHRVSGLSCWRRGNIEQATVHLRAALDIAEKEGTPFDRGNALVDLGNATIAGDRQSLQPLLELYSQAAALFAKEGNHVALARVLMNRSWAEWEAGETDLSLKDLHLAIEEAERAHSARWIVWCQFNLAQMQVELRQIASARVSLERAMYALRPGEDQVAEQQILMTRGMIEQADRSFEAAEASYQGALELARRLNAASDVVEVLFRQAELAHDRGDDARARTLLDQAIVGDLLGYHPNLAAHAATLERSVEPPPEQAAASPKTKPSGDGLGRI